MAWPIAAIALIGWAAAGQADPPPDPYCPQGDLAFPRDPGSVCIGELTDAYAFSVIHPHLAARSRVLDRLVRRDAQRRRKWLRRQVSALRAGRAEAGSEGDPPPRLSFEQGWRLDGDLPSLTALSSTWSAYAGGAHGSIGYDVILFDVRRRRRLQLADLFTDRAVAWAAVQPAFCRALLDQIRARRDGNIADVACPEALDQPVTLCGANGSVRTMLALLNPYVVGSHAEGPYEVAFPVTAEMIAALRPAYRAGFAPGSWDALPNAGCAG